MRGLAVVLILAGCNQVLGLESTQLVSAEVDGDGDRVRDEIDNCPTVFNPSQSDDDQDTLGDACDNCPLVPNFDQQELGDHDGIGDLCDPHPANDGDCLVLYDSFSDPAAFERDWMPLATTGTPEVHPDSGFVRLVPPGTADLTIVARDDQGALLSGTFDVALLASYPLPATPSRLAAVTRADASTGLVCMLRINQIAGLSPLSATAGGGVPSYETSNYYQSSPMSSVPLGETALLRLVAETETGAADVQCRIDWGVALGTLDNNSLPNTAGTGVGAVASGAPVDIKGIAIYRFQPGMTCPQAVVR